MTLPVRSLAILVVLAGGAAPAVYSFAVLGNRQLVLNVTKVCGAPTTYAVGGGAGHGALSEQERQIISATFNVVRDRAKS